MSTSDTPRKTSWGEVANWYDMVVESDDSYQKAVILPNVLRLMSLGKGDEVLDIACGQGFFSRAFHEIGATVTGIDIGAELIALAREKSSPEIEFCIGKAEELKDFGDGTFDKASIVLALQNIEHVQKALEAAGRVLRQKGKLYIVLNHPAFRIPDKSSWEFDEEKHVQYRRVDAYISESKKEMTMNPGAEEHKHLKTLSFHRPLQVYAKALFKAGFAITRLEEWISHKESEPGPRQKAENKARNEFPLFLAIECSKVL